MSTIYVGERRSGKTTMLIEMSERTGSPIVVRTYQMGREIQRLANQMGKNIPTPVTVGNYIRRFAYSGVREQKYLVDEFQMILSAMNIEAATADFVRNCIKILRSRQNGRSDL